MILGGLHFQKDKIKIFDSNKDFKIKIENLIFIEALIYLTMESV